jgi:hypothetical protein
MTAIRPRARAARHTGEALVERDQLRTCRQSRRKRQGVRQAQGLVARSQACRPTGEVAIDRDDRGANGIDKLIDPVAQAVRQRTNHHLRVDARADHDLRSPAEQGTENIHGALMLIVPGVQERDDYVGVEGYSRHSRRSSSRCPGGYVPAGSEPANRRARSSAGAT